MSSNRTPLRVLVIDDDFMIAKLHGKLVHSFSGYEWVGTAHNFAESIEQISQLQPDLILLDVYMPDQSGIQLLRTIRAEGKSCDVILITAAKEIEVVEEGFRLGVFDYLVKPFDLEHLKESLQNYSTFKSRLLTERQLNQELLHDLKNLRTSSHSKPSLQLQKGIDVKTLDKIKKSLSQLEGYHTVEQISHFAGISRSTVRTYVNFLVEEHWLEEDLQYGTVGRPQKLYRVNQYQNKKPQV